MKTRFCQGFWTFPINHFVILALVFVPLSFFNAFGEINSLMPGKQLFAEIRLPASLREVVQFLP